MFDDKEFGTIFPVRHGEATGTANERQMLDTLGGSSGFRTRILTDAQGNEVMLRTKNGMPQFETKTVKSAENKEPLGMDNGVVDLVAASIIEGFPGNNDAGKLYATQYVAENAVNRGDPATPIVDVIYPPNTKGVQPSDGESSKAFVRGVVSKKHMAMFCPPSIFTGKTRLYVQALYGRHEKSSTLTLNYGTETPSITLANGVKVTTSTGVYLDPKSNKHYLICVEAGAVKIYPMVTSVLAEKLRSKLGDTTIAASDRERIEAYILSRSEPVPSSVQTLSIDAGSGTCFGYGWHFNWDGTKADIVYVYNGVDGSGVPRLESYHMRLTFTLTGNTWSVGSELVEGPVYWRNQRNTYVIAAPNWTEFTLDKIGPKVGGTSGDAPYYVFYKKNTIRVCRFKAVTGQVSRGGTRTPSYMNPGSMATQGTDARDYRTWEAWSCNTVRLSCEDEACSCTSGNKTSNVYVMTSPVMDAVTPTSIPWFSGSMAVSGTYEVNSGKALPIGPLFTQGEYYEGTITVYGSGEGGTGSQTPHTITVAGHGGTNFWDMRGVPATWTSYIGTESTSYSTASITVVPFDDAEAVYMLTSTTEYSTESGTKIDKHGGHFFGATALGGINDEFPWYVTSTYEVMGIDYGTNLTTQSYSKESSHTTVQTKLVSSAAVVNGITIPSPNQFFAPENDSVQVDLSLKSSANGATFSKSTGVNRGNGSINLTDKPFSYVGWA